MRTFRLARSSRPGLLPAVLGEGPRSEVYIPGMRTVHTLQGRQRAPAIEPTKQGRRPIAPPRLVCTLESPVSLRVDDGQLGIRPGPASSVPVISPFRNTFRRTLASALAPDVIGPRSHGRRAQTARSLRCSLDSPPYDGRWFVATLPLLTHLVPAQAGFTRSYQSRPRAGCFCRQTV